MCVSEDNHEAFVLFDLVHGHDEAVAEHDLRVDSDSVAEHSHVELLPLVHFLVAHHNAALILSELHAAFQAAPGTYL